MGTDQVSFVGKAVVIYAKREMPDWEVRGFQRNAIYFQGHKYYLANQSPAKPPYLVRYELHAWPENFHDESKISFTYDEASVAERDQAVKVDRYEGTAHYALLPLYPLLGFCWSDFKERVLARYGFGAGAITGASLMLSVGVFMVEGIFILYFNHGFLEITFGNVLGMWLDYFIFWTAPFDCAIRYSQVLRNEDVPDGYLEWLFKFRLKT
jgi:hypothetical protein